jgi:glycerol-3-phosphate acyltransferase PlsY
MTAPLFLIPLAYLVGSLPTSILAGRLLAGIDIREHGSGNAGATNTFRVLGWKAGLGVALIDFAKGYFTVRLLAAPRLLSSLPALPAGFPAPLLPILLACAVIIGHILPLWAGFRGGKGVAAGAGAVFALQPVAAAICLGGFVLVLISSGLVSLASLTAALLLPLGSLLLAALTGRPPEPVWTIFTAAAALLILLMHRKNIVRLIRGQENRIDKLRLFGRRKQEPSSSSGTDPQQGDQRS